MANLCLFVGYILLLSSSGLSIPTEQTGILKNSSDTSLKPTNEPPTTLAPVNCAEKFDCQTCMDVGCLWAVCETEGSCQEGESEFCTPEDCVNNSTTTVAPTEPPTTEPPTEAPTELPTTAPPTTEAPTNPPPTEAPTTAAPTEPPTTAAPTQPPTEAPTTAAPTEPPTEAPTDAPTPPPSTTSAPPPPPEPRHFDAGSFIGGMVFAVAIIAVLYAAWRFWKARNDRNYHTLQETVHM